MAIIRHEIDTDIPLQLSEESIARLNALDNRPADTPEYTIEEIIKLRKMAEKIREKQMFSLRIKNSTVEWWKSFGKGYTGLMARFLDKAKEHPEWVKECL